MQCILLKPFSQVNRFRLNVIVNRNYFTIVKYNYDIKSTKKYIKYEKRGVLLRFMVLRFNKSG